MCPVFAEGGLYAFIVPSPKQRDLLRDGRYAMHAFTPEDLDDEFCVTGRAFPIEPGSLRDTLVAGYHGVIPDGSTLFEFATDNPDASAGPTAEEAALTEDLRMAKGEYKRAFESTSPSTSWT